MNPQKILDQLLGPESKIDARGRSEGRRNIVGIAGGLAAGGLLGLLVGNKKARKTAGKLAGGVVGYGGAAALGALAYRAFENWQADRQVPTSAAEAANSDGHGSTAYAMPPKENRYLPSSAPASNGRPFEIAIATAMIAAANADGHIGPAEMRVIFNHVNTLALDADDKAFVLDTLQNPPSVQEIADLAISPEQATELYLASRIAIDPDQPVERTYLDDLARRLNLPDELASHLDRQVSRSASEAA